MAGETLAATAATIAERPDLVEQASRLLGLCARADAILARWQATARRNKVTAEYCAFDVFIHATTARRIVAVAGLQKDWERLCALPPGARAEALKPHIEAFEALRKNYEHIVAMYDRSVLEAGGGKCGSGGWWPFVAQGGVQFAAPKAVEEIAKGLDYLERAAQAESAPDAAFAP